MAFVEGRGERGNEEVTTWLAELRVERAGGGEMCGVREERRWACTDGEDGVDGGVEDEGEDGEEIDDGDESSEPGVCGRPLEELDNS